MRGALLVVWVAQLQRLALSRGDGSAGDGAGGADADGGGGGGVADRTGRCAAWRMIRGGFRRTVC